MVHDESVRKLLANAMVAAGIVELENDRHMILNKDGREYLILLTVLDTTNFKTREQEDE